MSSLYSPSAPEEREWDKSQKCQSSSLSPSITKSPRKALQTVQLRMDALTSEALPLLYAFQLSWHEINIHVNQRPSGSPCGWWVGALWSPTGFSFVWPSVLHYNFINSKEVGSPTDGFCAHLFNAKRSFVEAFWKKKNHFWLRDPTSFLLTLFTVLWYFAKDRKKREREENKIKQQTY